MRADSSPDEAPRTERSGDYSRDDRFDRESVFEVVESAANAEQIADAMRTFLRLGDEDAFGRAVAVYVRSARARGESVEHVLGALNFFSEHVQDLSRSSAETRQVVQLSVSSSALESACQFAG